MSGLRIPGLGVVLSGLIMLTGCSSLVRQGRDAVGLGPKNEVVQRNLTYVQRPEGDLKLDLYVPKSSQAMPVVVWFHGGLWRYGTKEFNFHLRDLTQQGFAVATVQYRKIGEAPWPAALDDAEAGFSWLKENARQYGLDPDRMFLAGESAGGHVAALLASELGRSRVRALCLLYAPTDMDSLWAKYKDFSPSNQLFIEFFGTDQARAGDVVHQASPLRRVTRRMPPTLMYHGEHDWMVPLSQSQALATRLEQLGVETKLVVVNGQNHAFPLTTAQMAGVASFFRAHL